jgi:hypothetical protein
LDPLGEAQHPPQAYCSSIKATISATSSKGTQHESTISTTCTMTFSFKGTYHESTVTCFISWAAGFSSVTSS